MHVNEQGGGRGGGVDDGCGSIKTGFGFGPNWLLSTEYVGQVGHASVLPPGLCASRHLECVDQTTNVPP
jgi:hypothetical protein